MSETQPWKFFALQGLNFQFLELNFQFLEGNFKMSEPCDTAPHYRQRAPGPAVGLRLARRLAGTWATRPSGTGYRRRHVVCVGGPCRHCTPLNLYLAAGIEPTAKYTHSPPPQAAGQPERFSCNGAKF